MTASAGRGRKVLHFPRHLLSPHLEGAGVRDPEVLRFANAQTVASAVLVSCALLQHDQGVIAQRDNRSVGD